MSVEGNIRFNGENRKGYSKILSGTSKVDLNDLMRRVKEEEKKGRRNNLAISVAAL